MDENLKLTNTYKAEITDVLRKISAGLSEKVTAAIEPKIQNISLTVTSQNDLFQNIKSENKKSFDELNKRVENFGTVVKSFESTTENLGKYIGQQNSVIVSSIERNSYVINQLRKS